MPTNLAPVYLDDTRVQLQGDPRPRVSKIVAAGGKSVDDDTQVVRLVDQADERGRPVQLEDVIDRAQGPQPVYLRCVPAAAPEAGGQAFGAARPGMAGQGARGSAGDVPADKRAKSDFPPGEASGASNQTYGAGDLQPGGRTRLDRSPRPARGGPDSTQESQSGGRQGEGLEASYPDEGVGSTGRRQAGVRAASGASSPEQGAQGGAIRDSSTDSQGRPQGTRRQPAEGAAPTEDSD